MNVMSIRPPEELRRELKRYAQKKGFTVNQLVVQILWDWLAKISKGWCDSSVSCV